MVETVRGLLNAFDEYTTFSGQDDGMNGRAPDQSAYGAPAAGFRGILHGFIAQEEAGCFRQFPVDVEESDRMAVRGLILPLENEEKEEQA